MSRSQLVYEFQGSRNLNTNPIDITGLQGDTYDYELIVWTDVEGQNDNQDVTFNNDTTTNYRSYRMEGNGSTASAVVVDPASIAAGGNAYSYPALTIARITGSSGDERYMEGLYSMSASSGDVRVRKQSWYWKNTADEITSIQLPRGISFTGNYHILLYRTPKATSQSNWQKVGELTWSAESTEKSFTGLDGDRDKRYKIVWSGSASFRVEINNDSGSNYIDQTLKNSNGSISSTNITEPYIIGKPETEYIINAETGTKRLITVTGASTSSSQQNSRATWYTNTATNITSLDCTPAASATGTATLYRMKSGTETSGVLNWELVEEVDVSGDFSSGYTFSGLTGDSEKLFRITFEGSNTSTNNAIQFRPNSDSGSNYTRQYLRALTSTVSASSGSLTGIYISLARGGDQSFGEVLFYPKSGTQRPVLGFDTTDENLLQFQSTWWTNTADEISSILAYSTTTDSLTGKLKLWRLK